jgi:hypothetical protein
MPLRLVPRRRPDVRQAGDREFQPPLDHTGGRAGRLDGGFSGAPYLTHNVSPRVLATGRAFQRQQDSGIRFDSPRIGFGQSLLS